MHFPRSDSAWVAAPAVWARKQRGGIGAQSEVKNSKDPGRPQVSQIHTKGPSLYAEKTCLPLNSIQAGENSFSTWFTNHSLQRSSTLSQEVSVLTPAQTF